MMRRIFLILFLVLGLSVVSFAQQEPAKPSSETTPESAQQESAKVTAIEVKGNKAISSNTVVSKMKTRIGGPYQENIISDDLKRLYLLGFFSDIKMDTQIYKDGIKVIVTVVERPIIENIVFIGMRRITQAESKLKEQLKSREGQYLDYPNLTEDVRRLKKMYEKIGMPQVQIDYAADINKETNKAKVQFNIVEGGRLRIKDIIVEGNRAFRKGRILKVMKTKRAWLFNAGALREEVLKEDMERIKAFYQKNGFTDATAEFETSTGPKRPNLLYITVKIQEGKKYLVGNVRIQGNVDIPTKDILGKLKECVPGKVFSQEALKNDVTNIQSLYFDRGYILALVQETTSVEAYTGRVDILYNIVENEIAYVDKIKIRGNIKTKDLVIRRELRIRPGDRFDGEKLRRSKERLQNLGFFEDISYDTQDTPTPNKKDLVVEVKESKTGTFSFGGGYSTVDQFVGFIEVEQKNFDWKNFPYFTGAGQNLKLRASAGSLTSGFELSFTDPWLFDYPVSFGFDAYRRTHKRDEDVGYGYDEKITGGDLRLGREISEYLRADLTYRLDSIEISNVTDDATEELKQETGKNTISSFSPSLTFDNRDNIFDPTRGDLLSGSVELAGGALGGDKDFWKFYGRASHYFPLFRGSSLELRARVGMVKPYGDSDRIPIYERFFAGGAYTVRGYEERSIGPVDSVSEDPLGGEAMLIGNIEYTYPLLNFFKVAAFYDVGNVWAKQKDLGSGSLKAGVGIGVRLKTPIGPIMLDYGVPLNKVTGEEDKGSGRLHFSASHGF